MTGEMSFVFAILGVAVVLFASGRIRLDVVALLVLLALMLSGILSVPEALAGFSDSVVIMIAGLFLLGAAGEMIFARTQVPDVVWLIVAGVVLNATGSSRNAIFALIIFFLVGGGLLAKVDVEEGKREAARGEEGLTVV